MMVGTGFEVGHALPPANAQRGAGPRPANGPFIGAKKCRDDSRHSRLDSPGWCMGKLRHGGCGFVLTLLAFLLPCLAMASSTTAWEMGSWSDFIRGRFQGISLSREGRLSLAPKWKPFSVPINRSSGGGGSARWHALRRHRQPRTRLPHRPRRRLQPAVDRRPARGVRHRCRS